MIQKKMKGLFVVFEGCDKSGKTTQSKLLAKSLSNSVRYAFPDRETPVGQILDKYLSKETELSARVSHLLFSANRWELTEKIQELLNNGVNVILDRYFYSGIVYTLIKDPTLDIAWVKYPDSGLPLPDLVFYINKTYSSKRDPERYETDLFQSKVRAMFEEMAVENNWVNIDGNKTSKDIQRDILEVVEKFLKRQKNGVTNYN